MTELKDSFYALSPPSDITSAASGATSDGVERSGTGPGISWLPAY